MPESGLNSSTDYDPILTTLITAASRAIDKETGKPVDFFSPASTDSVYYYDGTGGDCLQVEGFTQITEVAVSEQGGLASTDYTVWSSSDYILTPYNELPYRAIEVDVINGSKLYFPRYRKAVRITGIRGYNATTPADVSLACRIQATRWFVRAKQQWSDTGAGSDFGGVTIQMGNRNFVTSRLDPDVAAMLAPYQWDAMA